MNHKTVQVWLDNYVKAWRTPGVERLGDLFTENVSYQVSPWKKPITGLARLGSFWDRARDEGEVFSLVSEIIAVEADTAVVRVAVTYAHDEPSQWRDLWILRFDNPGLCYYFEEWPFSPGQDDGQAAI